MKKKETKTAEEKIMKYLQNRKNQIIKAKQINVAMGKAGSVAYKTGATALARLCREGKLVRVKIGIYALVTKDTRLNEVKAKTDLTTKLQKTIQENINTQRWIDVSMALKRLYNFDVNAIKQDKQVILFNDVINKLKLGLSVDESVRLIEKSENLVPIQLHTLSVSTKFVFDNNDEVNRPSHYTTGKIEVIDYIEDKDFGFHLGNVVKYVSRAGKKDPKKMVQDLEKGKWYLDRIIANLKKTKC